MPILGPQRDFNSHEGERKVNGYTVRIYWASRTVINTYVGWWWAVDNPLPNGDSTDGPFLSSRDAYAAALYATARATRRPASR